ncbi:hypothetical protein DL95DRAFT_481158 [Leptodontidium sp. 2 PMI_412]|nr:hypothetical protein DL95DRAFT_481158 [Leptodontidium sp. 2 PMI_412]
MTTPRASGPKRRRSKACEACNNRKICLLLHELIPEQVLQGTVVVEIRFPRRTIRRQFESTAGNLQSLDSFQAQYDSRLEISDGNVHDPENGNLQCRKQKEVIAFLRRSHYITPDIRIDEALARAYPHSRNSESLSETSIKTLELWESFNLPQRATSQSLFDVYLERCYPWTPVIRPEDLAIFDQANFSLLLKQAIFVAGSRVTSGSGVVVYASTDEFYHRTKALFWQSHEKDPLIVIAATILLQRYNPDAPEQEKRLHSESSLFKWTRILPGSLRIRRSKTAISNEQAAYSFNARQLYLPSFTTVAMLTRTKSDQHNISPATILASSFVAGIFEDSLARDEQKFLPSVFTFYILATGVSFAPLRKYPTLWNVAQQDLKILRTALDQLGQRWASARGAKRALQNIICHSASSINSTTVEP